MHKIFHTHFTSVVCKSVSFSFILSSWASSSGDKYFMSSYNRGKREMIQISHKATHLLLNLKMSLNHWHSQWHNQSSDLALIDICLKDCLAKLIKSTSRSVRRLSCHTEVLHSYLWTLTSQGGGEPVFGKPPSLELWRRHSEKENVVGSLGHGGGRCFTFCCFLWTVTGGRSNTQITLKFLLHYNTLIFSSLFYPMWFTLSAFNHEDTTTKLRDSWWIGLKLMTIFIID